MSLRDVWDYTIMPAVGVASLCVLTLTSGCRRSDPLPPEVPGRLTIALHSSKFADNGKMPKAFTCDGSDQSPPLEWAGVPESSRALALICDDPDAPVGTWSHWVVFNLPAQVTGLKEGIPVNDAIPAEKMVAAELGVNDLSTARQGKNDFGNSGYGGPCPPSGTHHYFFRLYALDASLELKATATRSDVLTALKDHILAEGRLMVQYERGSKE
jgi:Raf kinase inhibitor-like YbhB/YbcL family protein